jgi:hypothetical protein
MKNQGKRQLLGAKLIEAGLISEQQLKVALEDQRSYNLKVGEILANHQWIRQRTADFFAVEWEIIKNICPKQPIGYYLRRAALLSEGQINYILEEQQKKGSKKFGEIAVKEKWLSQQTINYLLENLESHVCSIDCQRHNLNITFKKAILHINEPDIVIIKQENVIERKLQTAFETNLYELVGS